jgi:hypothetical protein
MLQGSALGLYRGCLSIAGVIVVSQLLIHSPRSPWRFTHRGPLHKVEALGVAASVEKSESLRGSRILSLPTQPCKYGGLEVPGGCICGRGTAGQRCEKLTVSAQQLSEMKVRGHWGGLMLEWVGVLIMYDL